MDKWKCPNCGESRIEEILINAVVASEVTDVPGDCLDLFYGKQTTEDGEVERYQCMTCGHVIASSSKEVVETLGGKIEDPDQL